MAGNTQLSYCQVMVGGFMTGLVGLAEVLDAMAAEGVPADAPGLAHRLVEAIQAHNYVPPRAADAYGEALLREYRTHLAQQATGRDGRKWRDPRKEQFPWYPTIFAAKCNGCGDCLPVCAAGVLGWNLEHSRVLVLEPYECARGCQLCARACRPGAIIMPPASVLHQRPAAGSASA